MIPGEYRTYLSSDREEIKEENELQYPVEILNTLTSGPALPGHKQRLKKKIPEVFFHNLDPLSGHFNVVRYIIEKRTNNILFLRLATGANAGTRLSSPLVPCDAGDDYIPVPAFTLSQFPIRVCFGLAKSKAQRPSFLGLLGLGLPNEYFSL